jgi:hypothetical protein
MIFGLEKMLVSNNRILWSKLITEERVEEVTDEFKNTDKPIARYKTDMI